MVSREVAQVRPLPRAMLGVAQAIESQAARIRELERLLGDARDEVADNLNHVLPMAGYPKPDREIAYLENLLAQIDAAMQAAQ